MHGYIYIKEAKMGEVNFDFSFNFIDAKVQNAGDGVSNAALALSSSVQTGDLVTLGFIALAIISLIVATFLFAKKVKTACNDHAASNLFLNNNSCVQKETFISSKKNVVFVILGILLSVSLLSFFFVASKALGSPNSGGTSINAYVDTDTGQINIDDTIITNNDSQP